MFDHLMTKILYIALTAAIMALMHLALYERWKQKELARRTVGVAMVLGLAFPLAVAGVLDWVTWLWTLFAFGVAGATTGTLHVWRDAERERQIAERLRGEIDNAEEAG